MSKAKLKVAAQLSVQRPGGMTSLGRNDIAKWLRRQAAHLVKHGAQYTETGAFRARYYY